MEMPFLLALHLLGCPTPSPTDVCSDNGGLDAPSTCQSATEPADYYVDQSLRYFDTLESDYPGEGGPEYAEGVARWEWPPWLKLTGYGREAMESADAIIRIIETSVPERDCRFFEQQPFGRCRVSFLYPDTSQQLCPIYEEFTFDALGRVNFIEAWSDTPAYLPDAESADAFLPDAEVGRLSTRIPGLGSPSGEIDVESEAMEAAAAADPDVADFVTRTRDFYGTWSAEYAASGEDVFATGCGW